MTNRNWKSLIGISITFLLGLFLSTVGAQAADDAASLYKSKCAACHAADGSGNSPTGKALKVPNLNSPDIQGKSDADLASAITKGKGKMAAIKGVTDAQAKDLVGYIRQIAKK